MDHLPPPEVCAWLLSLEWVGPFDADICYGPSRPDGITRSIRQQYYEARYSIGPDEIGYVQLPDDALELLRQEVETCTSA